MREKPIHIHGVGQLFWIPTPSHYGLSGSPTQVERIFPPENDVERETWTEGDLAEKLHDTLAQVEVYLREERTNGTDCIFGAQVHRLRPLRGKLPLRRDRHKGRASRI